MSGIPVRPARPPREKVQDFVEARGAEIRRMLSTGPRIAHFGLSNFARSHWIPLVQEMGEKVNVANRSKVAELSRKNGFEYPVVELWDEDEARLHRITAIADLAIIKDPDHDTIQRVEAHRQIAHAFAHRNVELITTTVTARSYFLDGTRQLDLSDEDVQECLQGPHRGTPVGILTQALLTRYRYGFTDRWLRFGKVGPSVPLAVMPLDNMDSNGETIRRLIIQYAKAWKPYRRGFHRWLEEEVLFLNTSADRIVEEADVDRRTAWLQKRFDADPELREEYPDLINQAKAAMFTEPFGDHRLVIARANLPTFLDEIETVRDIAKLRCPIDRSVLAGLSPDTVLTPDQKIRLAYPMLGDLARVGAKFVPSVTPHRAAKRSLVNTVHMALSLAGGLATAHRAEEELRATMVGDPAPAALLDTFAATHELAVHEVMGSAALKDYLKALQRQFHPVIKNYSDQEIEGLPDTELDAMGAEALERFANPQLHDELARPRRNAYDKVGEQVIPYIIALKAHDRPCDELSTALGLWILALAEKSRTAALYTEAHPSLLPNSGGQSQGNSPHVDREAASRGMFPLRDEHASSQALDAHELEFYKSPLAVIEAIAPTHQTETPTRTALAFRDLRNALKGEFSTYLLGAIDRAETLVDSIAQDLQPEQTLDVRDTADGVTNDITLSRTLHPKD